MRRREWDFVLLSTLSFFFLILVAGGVEVEEEECTSAYNYLAGCVTFLSGPDVVPSPVCCGGVNHLSTADAHCLCTIILELGTNPTVNFTKACALAYQCSAAVSFSECPALLYPLAPMPLPLPGDEASAAAAGREPRLGVAALLLGFWFL